MALERLSIKALTVGILSLIGLAAIILSIIVGQLFYTPALEEEKRVLANVIKVAGHELFKQLQQDVRDVGFATQKSSPFRKAIKNTNNPNNKIFVVDHLNDQFQQRIITSGKVALLKMRLYSSGLEFIAESSKGVSGLPRKLPDFLAQAAKSRKGGARLKTLSGFWLSPNNGPVGSVLVPVGALRVEGYLELVFDPARGLKELSTILTSPLKVTDINNTVHFVSENWPEKLQSNDLIVDFAFSTYDNKPVILVETVEDISKFNSIFLETKVVNGIAFVVMNIIGIFIAFYLFNKMLFRPLDVIIANMKRTADGDLTTSTTVSGLKELQNLGNHQSQLVSNLRQQVSQIFENATALSDAAATLLDVTEETNAGMLQQQSETSQVATAITQMSATVQEVSRHAETAAAAARSADDETQQGKEVVKRSIEVIDSLANDIQTTTGVISKLESDSEAIGSVMDVIQSIAEQTNLLALNAAIEAARAGEQGRGFAVVADEVRVLASRTQESTREIHEVIERIQEATHDAVKAMLASKEGANATVSQAAKAGESLEAITEVVAEISTMNTQIASAAEEQSAVAAEIDRSISSISNIANTTATGSSKVAESGRNLADLATRLQQLAEHFKL